jgi:hypothetical protein
VPAVASVASSIPTVAGISADVSAVAAIDDAVSIAAANVDDINNFADVYQGGKAADPTVRNDGSALQPGDLYFNTTMGRMRIYVFGVWDDAVSNAGSAVVESFSGTGSQTAFTLATDPLDKTNTQVFIAGVYQQKSEYSVLGTTLTFTAAPPSGTDNIEVVISTPVAFGNLSAIQVDVTAKSATATTQAGIATTQAGIATTQAGLAATAKTAAESARDAALIQAGVYTTEALGRAAVADGVAFKVQGSGDVAAYEYRRTNSTTSVLIATYPSAEKLAQFLSASIPNYPLAYVDVDDNPSQAFRADGTVVFGAVEVLKLNGVVMPMQRPAGNFDAEINHILSYGESRSVGTISFPLVTTAQRFDSLKFNGGVRSTDAGGTTAANHASLVPLVEGNLTGTLGETPCGGMTDAIKELILAENNITYSQHSYQLLGSAPGLSGAKVADIALGTAPYTRLTDDISYGYALAQAAGKSYKVRSVSLMLGHNDAYAQTAPATYKASVTTLVNNITSTAAAICGQVEPVVCIQDQVCSHVLAGAPSPAIALAQRDLQRTAGNNIYVSCPSYFASGAAVHHLGPETKWIAAYHGLVHKRVAIDGLDWQPLDTISAYRQGVLAFARFRVPVAPLVFDTASVAAQPNYGFTLVTSAGVDIPVTAVAITSHGTVKITAGSAIPAGAKLRYGFTGIGNLRDSQGDALTFDGGGLNFPMHNWCLIFEETLA